MKLGLRQRQARSPESHPNSEALLSASMLFTQVCCIMISEFDQSGVESGRWKWDFAYTALGEIGDILGRRSGNESGQGDKVGLHFDDV